MKPIIHISPFAVLTAALFYFFMGASRLPSLLLAVVLHELGHIAAMAALGMEIKRIDVEPSGLCIHYNSTQDMLDDILSAACGPISGIVFGLFAVKSSAEWLRLSGDISLLLSAFNLLPIMPLDGGRMTACTVDILTHGERPQLAGSISLSAAVLVFGWGIYLAAHGGGLAVCVAGGWLVWGSLHPSDPA